VLGVAPTDVPGCSSRSPPGTAMGRGVIRPDRVPSCMRLENNVAALRAGLSPPPWNSEEP
jgi:hypothetical protein